MNLISFPAWAQTALTIVGGLAVALPALVHLIGAQDTNAGQHITTIGADVVGLIKRLNGSAS